MKSFTVILATTSGSASVPYIQATSLVHLTTLEYSQVLNNYSVHWFLIGYGRKKKLCIIVSVIMLRQLLYCFFSFAAKFPSI